MASSKTPENVKSRLFFIVNEIKGSGNTRVIGVNYQIGTSQLILNRIKRFEEHPEEFKLAEPLPMPDGSPIGDFDGL